MIILVISDTHKDLKNARLVIQHQMKNSLDMVIHCGDHIEDAKKLEKSFPKITFHYVPGNCDGWFFKESERTKVVQVHDKKILFTHGDTHNIKNSYNILFQDVKEKGGDIGLCGHSHIAHLERREGTEITVINPGSITLPRDSRYPSYAILEVEEGQETGIEMMIIKDGKSIKNPFLK